MHEVSIAMAVADTIRRARPAGATVDSVRMLTGPLRGVVGEAMQWAWAAATKGTDLEGVTLHVECPQWRLVCGTCGGRYESDDLFTPCACGGYGSPVGGNELQVVSMSVRDPAPVRR